jgi:hypothetical protein
MIIYVVSTLNDNLVVAHGHSLITLVIICAGWDFWYIVSTLRPFVTLQRPMPRQTHSMTIPQRLTNLASRLYLFLQDGTFGMLSAH